MFLFRIRIAKALISSRCNNLAFNILLGAVFANEGIQIPCLESWSRPGTVIRCVSAYPLPFATFAVTTCCLVLHKQVSHIPSYLLHTDIARSHTPTLTHGHEMLSVIINSWLPTALAELRLLVRDRCLIYHFPTIFVVATLPLLRLLLLLLFVLAAKAWLQQHSTVAMAVCYRIHLSSYCASP